MTNTEHHPSCTENDKDLVLHCHQCGLNESYDLDTDDIEALKAHKARLDKELPEMRKENRRLTAFLQDAAAFIRESNSDKGSWNSNIVLATLVHDITGLANDEPCFSPRVTGYAARERSVQQDGSAHWSQSTSDQGMKL
jgi:hypothetical protein